ncbi:long-chain acyl-CoA synthetase [Encephalitozoon hellem ATCC 50504]|uniref:long-chain acyl-CoA synthetase n=1 Tax=Encephalitozoon hellem (strain ATCC 50504) TaxID=907965 RepID=UPI000269D925|nr:long-chain acyl-CoA synthetase [Encephalitozoon hellem ATCC 50504]AFM99185.1 long-chain acyl-CoA synthetase [Encephalitozoon hellem ATCC 50504]|eukprot:XP_003888166.1 long-chain acyl-CoA synthetase [Encephalitozoon hellem ATCC 50504]
MGGIRFTAVKSFFASVVILSSLVFADYAQVTNGKGIKGFVPDAPKGSMKAGSPGSNESAIVSNLRDIMGRIRVMDDGSVQHVNFQQGVVCAPDGSKTVLEIFLTRCSTAGSDPLFGTISGGEVVYKSASETLRDVKGIASFLSKMTEPKDIVGIYSVNRYEWIVAEMASYMCGCTNVPLYSTFSPENVQLILEETEMKVCIASADKAKLLLESVLESRGKLSCVILMDRDENVKEMLENVGVRVEYFWDVVSTDVDVDGTRYPSGDDLATICYTSGTSGKPKGVMLTHKNFISGVAGIFRGSNEGEMVRLSRDDVYLSYLPLAHVMERICINISMAYGCKIVFYRGNPREIKEDYLVAKPTFIISVPRVLNLFKEKIEENVRQKNIFVRGVFRAALWYKMWGVAVKGELKNRFLDWLVFNRISREFGGRIEKILCGSAPLKKDVLVYMQAVLSCRIFQGYGQTENVGAGIVQPLDNQVYDNVGIPFPSNEVKLGEISDELRSEYVRRYPSCRVGEILLRGDNVTQGYFKRPEETRELFTSDGWLRTGDIGMFDTRTGMFSVIGRVKDGFKTSQGEYIDPEKLEVLYSDGEVVQDMCIPRRSDSDKIVAIAVCPGTQKSDKEIFQHVLSTGERLFKQKKITKLEIPWRVIVVRQGLEALCSGEFVTPTGKKRRPVIEKFFEKEINKALGIK